ncbi:MAG: 3-deoxy-manno-octulosonate cytidylyltransferase [Elusimicrobia bacterium]|nr:3-deoxy-manno-octulosonate cytidylyltransferase [Elusimicrobiota bacterium]
MKNSSKSDSVLIVIPARYGSTRFPGKPLAKIAGKPMIQWVYEAAQKTMKPVVVATDDSRIQKAVESFGGRAVLTPKSCFSGTDRVAHVARKTKSDIVINLQGDEPLISPKTIQKVIQILKRNKKAVMSTAACEVPRALLTSPNVVQVKIDASHKALAFSRELNGGRNQSGYPLKHIGIYGYRKNFLLKFAGLPQTSSEKKHCLEQFRAMENGYPIHVAKVRNDTVAVDLPEDIQKVEQTMLEAKHSRPLGLEETRG